MTVADIGAGEAPDPRADVTVDRRPVADRQADLDGAWPLQTASCDRIIASHVIEHLDDVPHAFREAARCLCDGGRFEVTVPLGDNAIMDDAHETIWTYHSPEQYCQVRQRPWDPDVPFVLEERDLSLAWRGPLESWSPWLERVATVWPQWACNRADWGELTAEYRRVGGEP